MGHSLAMNVVVYKTNLDSILSEKNMENTLRTEIAVGRRGLLASGYKNPILEKVELLAVYNDINNRIYNTEYVKLQHKFGKGKLKKMGYYSLEVRNVTTQLLFPIYSSDFSLMLDGFLKEIFI
jgi:uncharacterized protein YdbL (DUF1318 family)